ncbi:beta-1,3-galactosyltransferase 5 [Rhipicephalus sanguineus]|uniref:beta-1,3-galactosyltransferase 5 n=1 Tax=Rhipicephalus sanguineus TaxID=34632 RepID=UPI001895CDEB|nr:beta-1,3-galactosyltransferase 5 [Rhipicephalus sanguineus]
MSETNTSCKLWKSTYANKWYIILFFIGNAIIITVLFTGRDTYTLKPLQHSAKVKKTTSYSQGTRAPRSTHGWKTLTACNNPALRILFIVHTTPSGIQKRRWLRKTIGDPYVQSSVNSSIIFFVGASIDQRQQRALQDEAIREGDIVLLNITESHHNQSLKFLLGARWVLEKCSLDSATALVKMHEDILVNIYALSSYVSSSVMWLTGIHGVVYTNRSPVRERKSEWYVSKQDYASRVYPNYCCGDAFIMKPAVLSTLVDAAVLVPYFWIEDVYVTGIVGDFANVNLVDLSGHVIMSKQKNMRTVSDTTLFVNSRLARLSDGKKTSLWNDILRRNQSVQREFRKNVEVYYRSVG